MLQVVSFGCQEFGWSLQYVTEELPLKWLFLLARQKNYNMDPDSGFTLEDQERLDGLAGTPWEEVVRRNREQLLEKGINTVKRG